MAEINWTEESEKWLKDIHDYIAEDKPQAAIRVVEGIYEKTQVLRDNSLNWATDMNGILTNISVFCFMVIIESHIS